MSDYKGKLPARTDGIYEVATNEEPASSGLVASERVASKTVANMLKRVSAQDGDNDRTCIDVALADGDANGIDKDNPMPVYMTDSPAAEIEEYDVQSATKSGGFVNHDYVTTAEFRDLNVQASSSGLGKFELQESADGITFTTKMVKFNSVAQPNVDFDWKKPKSIPTGYTIRLIKTNLDNQDTDMYSIINGTEQ